MRRLFSVLATVALFSTFSVASFAQGFGGAVAVSGSDVIVGETGNGSFAGSIYVFNKMDDGSWAESYQMEAGSDASGGDGYGRAISANDWHMVVGSPMTNTAYVYERQEDGSWNAGTALTAPDVMEEDGFGSRVAMGHGYLLVASLSQNENAGAVYVYRQSDNGWTQEAKLAPEGLAAGALFGTSMVAEDGWALIGAPARAGGFGRRGQEFTEVGSVYVYGNMDGEWTETGQVGPQGISEGGGFGSSIAVSEGKAAIGAPFDAQMSGTVSLFDWDEESMAYSASGKLAPFVSARGNQFGAFVSIDDSGVFVGTPGDSRGLGATYWFESDGEGGFSNAMKSGAEGVSGRASYGATLAGSGGIAVIGATGVDSRAGAAVIFEMTEEGWSESAVVVNQPKGFAAISGDEVRCEDNTAADFECSNVDIVSFLPLMEIGGSRGSMVNDIWGWSDSESGKEYALVGRSDGTSFVDVTNPGMPTYLGNLPMTEGSNAAAWRDMKVYQDHVYIVADGAGQHGMQVFDLTRLRDMNGTNPGIIEADFLYTEIASSHNIVINEATGFGYSVGSSSGGETCGGGLHMIDLHNPKLPTFIGCFADPSTGRRGTGYSHDAQCVTYAGPDTEHAGKEICMGSNETALSIADVSDKDNPEAISMVVYPNVAYAHQGWLSEDHEFFYMNDEGDEPQGLVDGTRTLVWDVRDLDEPVLVNEYIATTTTTDHNLYIKDNLMYQSNYGSGLRILDITDRENPVEVGFLDTTPNGGGGSWSNYPYFNSGAIAVTSMGEGLFMVRKQDQGL